MVVKRKKKRGPPVAVNEFGRRIGEDHPASKLTDHEVELIQQLREAGWRYIDLAHKFEISKSHVHDICTGRRRCQTTMGHVYRRVLPAGVKRYRQKRKAQRRAKALERCA